MKTDGNHNRRAWVTDGIYMDIIPQHFNKETLATWPCTYIYIADDDFESMIIGKAA
jgi:hypothetical protein